MMWRVLNSWETFQKRFLIGRNTQNSPDLPPFWTARCDFQRYYLRTWSKFPRSGSLWKPGKPGKNNILKHRNFSVFGTLISMFCQWFVLHFGLIVVDSSYFYRRRRRKFCLFVWLCARARAPPTNADVTRTEESNAAGLTFLFWILEKQDGVPV